MSAPVAAIGAATACSVARRPFTLDGVVVGSVAVAHLPWLAGHPSLDIGDSHVAWRGARGRRDAELDALHRRLRADGRLRGWRDEAFAIVDPGTLAPLAVIERAAARFWGTLTFGAHATGYVAGADGRPTHLWIAQRAADKATDPGLFDNLVGGGVPHGQSPAQTLQREAWEEAGLDAAVASGARAASVLRLQRDVAEGFQHEWLYSWDLALPAGLTPCNQDGEVAGFTLLPAAEAMALAAGRAMTVDAALVTLDFGLRHGLIDAAAAAGLAAQLAPLRVVRPGSPA